MKSLYYKKLSPIAVAVLDLMDYEGGQMITRINVPKAFRGQGIARELLRECCCDADQAKTTLCLTINSSDGLSFNELLAWYKRVGFKDVGHGLMMRRPELQCEEKGVK